MTAWVEWDDPGPVEGNIHYKITVQEAIERAKRLGKSCGCPYKNDADALQDFITINWAWITEEGD